MKQILVLLIPVFIFSTALSGQKNNVLLITVDTLRVDRVSVYSEKYLQTPNMDSLARRGAVFKRAFAHTPVTLPSHASILTGTTPLYHGISDNNRFHLDERFLTLAEHLKKQGYQSAAFTASFVLNERYGLNQGFDRYSGPELSVQLTAEEVIGPAVKWIGGTRGPWFLWIHLWDPHTPYDPPEPFRTGFGADLYSGEVAYTDSQLGILFDYLGEKGLFENTAVVLTADHGEALGDHNEMAHGYFVYNETIHVPLIICAPGIRHAVIENNVSHMDLFPTICDLVRIASPHQVQGRSLVPLMKGGALPEEAVYIEAKSAFYNQGWPPLTGFIEKDMKFIQLPIPELYDLKKDYREKRNIISSVNIPETSGKLDRLVSDLTGPHKGLAKRGDNQNALKKLRALGYLTGTAEKNRSVFSEEDDPKIKLPYFHAASLENKGKFNEALKFLFAIRESFPEYTGSSVRIADIYIDTGQTESGLRFVGEELERHPANVDLLLRKGVLQIKDKQYSPGGETLKKVIRKLREPAGIGPGTGEPRPRENYRKEIRRSILTLKHRFYNRLKPRARAHLQAVLALLEQ